MGVVPRDVSQETADEGRAWSAPSLKDFTDTGWEGLSDGEKRRIAGHYAWAAALPPETFGDLKLPHHDPHSHKVVWRGVANAMARLNQANIPGADAAAVRRHLHKHYKAFKRGDEFPGEQEAAILDGVTPPGMEHVVKQLKHRKGVDNPWALAWFIKHRQGQKAAILSDDEVDRCVEDWNRLRDAGFASTMYEHAAMGEIAACAAALTPGFVYRLS